MRPTFQGVTATVVAAGAVPSWCAPAAHTSRTSADRSTWVRTGCSSRTCAAPSTSARWWPRAGTPRWARVRPGDCPEESDEPLVLIVLETTEALDDLDAVLAVDGLDGIYVGPS